MARGTSKRSVYVIVREFRVKEGAEGDFEAIFGPRGTRNRLLAGAEGYLGCDLIRGDADRSRYLLVDRWRSPRAFDRFRTRDIDGDDEAAERMHELIEHEREVGDFVVAESEAG